MGVEREGQVFVDVIAGHQVDPRVAVLPDGVGISYSAAVNLAVGLALPVHATPYGDRVRVAVTGRAQFGIVVIDLLSQGGFDFPVIGQAMLKGCEGGARLYVRAASVGSRIERTAEVSTALVREVHRVAAPERVPWLDVLVVHAEGQQGIGV